jgi:hypothetical protein
MMLHSCLTASLVVCGVIALACTDASVAATKPAPQELWELYPLDPAGSRGREHERMATATSPTTAPRTTPTPDAPPSGVAGVSTKQRPRTADKADSGSGGTPLGIGLMLGVAAAGITLLALAALPRDRGPNRVAELVAARRVDMMVAGAFALLFVTVVYFVGVK